MFLKQSDNGLKTKKIFSCLVLLAVMCSVLFMALPGIAGAAGTPATELTVKLNGNLVKTYTISDLQSMTQITQGYSSIDSMPAPCMTAAQGVKVTDILTKAGIDTGSVQNIKFKSTDGYIVSLTKQYLLDTPRYYYPNLTNYWDTTNNCVYGAYSEGKVQVDPILALISYYKRFGSAPEFDLMDDANALRLCFGQDPNNIMETTSNKFAKYVNELDAVPLAQPPILTAGANNTVGQVVYLSFTDNENWRKAVTGITVNGASIGCNYTLAAGVITIDGSVFNAAGSYDIAVQATGYQNATIIVTVVGAAHAIYTVTPVEDTVYQIGSTDGIATMTVNSDVSGMKYFAAQMEPVIAHDGTEAVVFVHLRNGLQDNINVTKADFDAVGIAQAQAGFNVQPGDIVKVYIVDDLTNAVDFNPTVLQ